VKRIAQKELLAFQSDRAAGDAAIGAQDLHVHRRRGEGVNELIGSPGLLEVDGELSLRLRLCHAQTLADDATGRLG
jgi:hypothetical protein